MAENKELHELVDSLFADNDKIDAIDAQVLYTALMTDTLLEEGE